MEMTKHITLTGASRTPYLFTVHLWEQRLISISAVYAVLRRMRVGYGTIYIGSSADLKTHFEEHDLLKKFIQQGVTHIGIHVDNTVSSQHTKKMDLISSYVPELNLHGKEFKRYR